MSASRAALDPIASVLFQDEIHFGDLFNASREYKALLTEIAGFMPEEMERNDLFTDAGKAVGTKWAANCIEDIMRTRHFAYGTYLAVQHLLKQKQRVHLLYAGTGPFAALVLPLITKFSSDEVQFTFLEINEASYNGLSKVVAHFEMEPYITHMECGDATKYTVDHPETIDILLTETMMHGLKGEHQVAISYHLMSQLSDDALLIPEEIQLNLLGVNEDKRDVYKRQVDSNVAYYEDFGSLFVLNKEEIRRHQAHFLEHAPRVIFPEQEVALAEDTSLRFDTLYVETAIRVWGEIRLGKDESGLTTLLKLKQLDPMMQAPSRATSKYICGANPGLQFRFHD